MDTAAPAARPIVMSQTSPYPRELADMVAAMRYRPGWSFALADYDRGQDSIGLTLIITAVVPDAYDLDTMIAVTHLMPVPPAAYLGASWRRWLLDQCLLVDRHEACELFMIGDERPFAPNHGPGEDPYRITELTTEQARRTSFRGVLDDDGSGRSRTHTPPAADPGGQDVDGPARHLAATPIADLM